MMPHWLDLKYFLAVCESKNISRAAEVLGISQPSLSLAIKRLETVAQTPLLVRNKTGVDLTRAGVAFRDRSSELLQLWQSISEEVKRKHDEVSGRYVLGAHISVALMSLVPVVTKLMELFPGLELSITHGWSRIITDQVISFDIDYALVVNPCDHPDLVIKEVGRDVVGFFVRPDRFDREVLIYDPNMLQCQTLLKSLKSHGITFKRTITSSSLEFIARLTQEGVGVGLMPARVMKNLSGPIPIMWDPSLPQFHDRHCIIYRADAHTTKSSKLLLQTLKELLLTSIELER